MSNLSPKSCDLSWKSPDKDGGSPVIEYIIESSTDGEECILLGKVDKYRNTFQVKELEEDKQYTFRVIAVNKVGPSKPLTSDTVKVGKEPTAPDMPEGPLEVKDIQKDSMSLSWQPPKSDGGSPITGYTVEKREPNRNMWTPVQRLNGDVTSCVADKLLDGKDYLFRVVAENKKGSSKPLETGKAHTAKSPYGEFATKK